MAAAPVIKTDAMSVAALTERRAPPSEPLPEGTELQSRPEPCALVIFGATGDFTRRKLVPALRALSGPARSRSRTVLSDAIGAGDRVTLDALEGELSFDVGGARESEEADEREVSAEPASR